MIETERLWLRPLTINDTEDVFEYSRSAFVGPDAGWKPHENIEETEEIMKTIFIDQENVFGIELKESGKIIGSIGLIEDPKRENERSRMIGYALKHEYWGKGIMTEAAEALISYGFKKMELNVISAYTYPYNERSKGILKYCGFEYEGTLRRAEVRYDGEVLDNDCWSLFNQYQK